MDVPWYYHIKERCGIRNQKRQSCGNESSDDEGISCYDSSDLGLDSSDDEDVNDLNDMKSRYQKCLSKTNELYLRLAESQSEELKNYIPLTLVTPISPTNSVDRMSLSQTFIYSELK
ncbi:1273_t:CDS:2 [Acaulospora morrowiae]|uniref:1273_t:CDS:1 n=1 Tax=Acaulospora morrowiae TaxID=94023 RepID=A0A9N9GTL9_9GLOM|nr:1273_t:CDS:2 [Acaulospora morrowiae]